MRIAGTFTLICLTAVCYAQKITTFEIDLSKTTNDLDVPVSINLDPITFDADSLLTLSMVVGTKRVPIPFQISRGTTRTMHWIIPAGSVAKKISFELSKGKPVAFEKIKAPRVNGELTIQSGDKNLLRYVYKTVYPPAGQDSAYRRSGFIHPLWTPSGKILTRIQAPDHYHHYGIWNPWTHVLFEGDTLDFWNIKGKKGTVRFSRFVSVTEGPVFAEFAALHEHVAFKKNGKEKVALNELQTVRVYNPTKKDYYIVDITVQLNCAGISPFRILEYRYAGMGWRATEQWNQTNSEAMTSEGKTRKDGDGTTARWFYYEGPLDSEYGGAEMMSYPSNYNFPEPLRIWPENSNNGEVFAMFAPTKNKDWLLEPGKTYTLKYRFVVYDGHFNREKADHAWNSYAAPPAVTIKK